MINENIPVSSTINEKITEISLELSSNFTKDNYYIILEGVDDYYFFNKFFDSKHLINTESGKDAVIKICNHFFDEKRCIGIVDIDYQICTYLNNKIFRYDYSCLEMMLISNDEIKKSLKGECLFNDNFDLKIYLNYIFNNLHFLSLLRKFNYTAGKDIKFNGLKFSNILSSNKRNLDPNDIVTELEKFNRPNFISTSERNSLINESIKFQEFDYFLNITQGHDFINMLKTLISIDKSINRNEKYYHSILRTSYRSEDLLKTDLFVDLDQYFSKELNKDLKKLILQS